MTINCDYCKKPTPAKWFLATEPYTMSMSAYCTTHLLEKARAALKVEKKEAEA